MSGSKRGRNITVYKQLKIVEYGNCHPEAMYEKEPYIVSYFCNNFSLSSCFTHNSNPFSTLQPKESWSAILIMLFYIKPFAGPLFPSE